MYVYMCVCVEASSLAEDVQVLHHAVLSGVSKNDDEWRNDDVGGRMTNGGKLSEPLITSGMQKLKVG